MSQPPVFSSLVVSTTDNTDTVTENDTENSASSSCLYVCVPQTQGAGSPRSSPSHTVSRSIPTPIHSDSAGTTPTHTPQDSLMGVGGDVQEAFAQGKTVRHECTRILSGTWVAVL